MLLLFFFSLLLHTFLIGLIIITREYLTHSAKLLFFIPYMLLEQLTISKYHNIAAITYFQLRITFVVLLEKMDLNRKCYEVLILKIIVHQFYYDVSLLMF
jgi:hypothetical protein